MLVRTSVRARRIIALVVFSRGQDGVKPGERLALKNGLAGYGFQGAEREDKKGGGEGFPELGVDHRGSTGETGFCLVRGFEGSSAVTATCLRPEAGG